MEIQIKDFLLDDRLSFVGFEIKTNFYLHHLNPCIHYQKKKYILEDIYLEKEEQLLIYLTFNADNSVYTLHEDLNI